MKLFIASGLALVAALSIAGSAQASHKGGKCVMAGGEATMVTEDLAKFMAGAALKNSMTAHGWMAHGPVKMKCDSANMLPHCKALQRACA